MSEPDAPLLSRTGQMWKVRAAIYWCPILQIALLAATLSALVPGSDEAKGWALLIFTPLLWSFAGWAVVATRCPNCGTRLFLDAARKKPLYEWWDWLVSLRECPVCHHQRSVRVQHPPAVG